MPENFQTLISIAAIGYLLSLICLSTSILKNQPIMRGFAITLNLLATVVHGYLLYKAIDVHTGQDLNLINVFAFISWLTHVLITVGGVAFPLFNMAMITVPLCIVALFLKMCCPSVPVIMSIDKPIHLAHILFAFSAYSLLTLATIEAICMAVQERIIHKRPFSRILKIMPPIQSVEKLLFGTLWLGFILLSISLLTGTKKPIDFNNMEQLAKVGLSVLAWLFFISLLWGRHRFGWRSQTAVYWTIFGYIILMAAYFGTKILESAS